MGKNVKSQFLYCINSNFKEGMSKHSLKSQGYEKQTKIFSYSDRKNLIDTSCHFSNWLKETYPDVKMVRDIKNNHLQEYLNSNSHKWTKDTIQVKLSHFKKLEKLSNQTFKNSKVSFNRDIVTPNGRDKSRSLSMTRDDYNKLMNAIKGSKSQGVRALELSGRFGLRVSEISKLQYRDIQKINDSHYKLNIIDSKGKRDRILDIKNKADINYLEALKKGLNIMDRLVNISSSSINKFVCRSLKKVDLQQYVEHKTSIHCIRKMVAQEQYDKFREQGLSRQDSLDRVSFFLGHGKNRSECIERYVLNTW